KLAAWREWLPHSLDWLRPQPVKWTLPANLIVEHQKAAIPAGLPPGPNSQFLKTPGLISHWATSPFTVSSRRTPFLFLMVIGNSPILVRLPSPLLMRQPATFPEPGSTSYRNRPSWLTRMSRGVEPWIFGGTGASVVPAMASRSVSFPRFPML